MTRLLLIRHGETDAVRDKRYCGSTDEPLNAAGRRQMIALRSLVKPPDPGFVYCSDLTRARESAELLFPGNASRIRVESSLREMNFGLWERLTYEEIVARDRESYDAWLAGSGAARAPGGESLEQLRDRVVTATLKILDAHKGRCVAIVSHGGPIAVSCCHFAGISVREFWSYLPAPASIVELII